MGTSSSSANPYVADEVLDSDTISRNIVRMLQDKHVYNYSEPETLNWNTMRPGRTGPMSGGAQRNRYDQYHPDGLINRLMNPTPQSGGHVGSDDSIGFNEMSDNVLHMLRRQIQPSFATTEGTIGFNTGAGATHPMSGGGCGCDGGDQGRPLVSSVTSPQPIDYNVLRGGAKDEDEDDDLEEGLDEAKKPNANANANAKNKDRDKSKTKRKEKEDEDDEDLDEDEDLDIEEEEDFDEDEEPSRLAKRMETDTVGSRGADEIIKPFYSSDSDYYNIKQRTGRFN